MLSTAKKNWIQYRKKQSMSALAFYFRAGRSLWRQSPDFPHLLTCVSEHKCLKEQLEDVSCSIRKCIWSSLITNSFTKVKNTSYSKMCGHHVLSTSYSALQIHLYLSTLFSNVDLSCRCRLYCYLFIYLFSLWSYKLCLPVRWAQGGIYHMPCQVVAPWDQTSQVWTKGSGMCLG